MCDASAVGYSVLFLQ